MKILNKFVLPAVLLALLAGCGSVPDAITLRTPENRSEVALLSPAQKAYLAMPRTERIVYFADPAKRVEMAEAGYYPQTVCLTWSPLTAGSRQYTVTMSENPDLSAPCFTIKTDLEKAGAGNLKIAQTYYWQVVSVSGEQPVASPVFSFRTEDRAPRLIRIDGVPNVRDFGGRKTSGGHRVKQGKVFRTAGLNDNAHPVYEKEAVLLAKNGGRLAKRKTAKDAEVARLKRELAAGVEPALLPCAVTGKWTAFRPDPKSFDRSAAVKLESVPATFAGARAENVEMNANGDFAFSRPELNSPAVFLQAFESPADGVMQLGAGADWYWLLAVNGKTVYDMMDGNDKFPIAKTNYIFNIPVRKGKNLLCAVVLSGSASWAWSCGSVKQTASAKILQNRIDCLEKQFAAKLKVPAGMEPGKNRLDDAMKHYMLDVLGIKSDIDLRSASECFGMTGSPLGDRVRWFHYSSSAYGGMQTESGRAAFTKVFRVFLDEANYPIVFHCIAGQDRTGAVAFILNGLLGVSEEELYLDWEVTGWWNKRADFNHEKRFSKLVAGFQKLPGKTLNEKIEAYVLSLGFTAQDLEKFRAIMLE